MEYPLPIKRFAESNPARGESQCDSPSTLRRSLFLTNSCPSCLYGRSLSIGESDHLYLHTGVSLHALYDNHELGHRYSLKSTQTYTQRWHGNQSRGRDRYEGDGGQGTSRALSPVSYKLHSLTNSPASCILLSLSLVRAIWPGALNNKCASPIVIELVRYEHVPP